MTSIEKSPPGAFPTEVVYASGERRRGVRYGLARLLLEHLPGFAEEDVNGIEIHHDSLGRPFLTINAAPGPAVSFSYVNHTVWAAAGNLDSGLGIDSAGSYEFTDGYPLDRILSETELTHAMRVVDSVAEAVALIWTLKESSVKALGTGFHCHDPKDVVCGAPRQEKNGYVFTVDAGRRLLAWTHRIGNEWVSIATGRCRNGFGIEKTAQMA